MPRAFSEAHFKAGCRHSVCFAGRVNPPSLTPRKIDYHKLAKRLSFVADALKTRTLSDEELKGALSLIHQSIGVFSMQDEAGKTRFFTSYTKGTERYAKKNSAQIMDYIDSHLQAGWQAFFLTLTCDIKKYANRYEAWKNYRKQEVLPVLENLRKHKHLEYVGVMESTARGYPHIHLVLFFPKDTFAGYDKMKQAQVLYYGKLFQEIKRKRFSPTTRLQALKGENAKWYLTKYITKGTERDVFKIRSKKSSLTQTERKCALELVIMKALELRTFSICKNRSKKDFDFDFFFDDVSVFGERAFYKDFLDKSRAGTLELSDFARLRAFLIKLCTNSPFPCLSSCRSVSLSQFQRFFGDSKPSSIQKSEQSDLLFDSAGKKQGCAGCFLSHLWAFIATGHDSFIECRRYFSVEDDSYVKITDGYDMSNDYEWFLCLQNILRYFLKGFSMGKSIRELGTPCVKELREERKFVKETLSDSERTKNLIRGRFRITSVHCYLQPGEYFYVIGLCDLDGNFEGPLYTNLMCKRDKGYIDKNTDRNFNFNSFLFACGVDPCNDTFLYDDLVGKEYKAWVTPPLDGFVENKILLF